MRHLLEVDDLTPGELEAVLELAAGDAGRPLAGRGAALLFEKPSARTRHSTEMAIVQLGGHPITVRGDEVGLDVRETVEDVTRTLAGYHAVVGARVFAHSTVERMAAVDVVPVVNLLSDEAHPLQAIADVLTLRQELGDLAGRTFAWVGDANNVLRSFAIACGMVGASVRAACPAGYRFDDGDLDRIGASGAALEVLDDPVEAATGSHAVYTDVWASMGQEDEAAARRDAFAGYQIDQAVVEAMAPGGIVLHCLPAHRGEEISADVLEGPASRVWRQAENRMHAARALVAWLVAEAS